jgi:hypothetical protein
VTAFNDQRVKRALEPGMGLFVGTVDERGTPSCCRAVALRAGDADGTVVAYVPVATSRDTIANVAMTRRVAVVATHPIDHCSVQLKGTACTTRLARDEERDIIRARLEKFADILDTIGLPRRVVRSVAHWPSFAIEVRVEDVFDQTPGPKAGGRLG